MIVQIYEIQTPYEAEQCIEAGVDHIGSVLLSQAEWKQPHIRELIQLGENTPVKNSIIPLFNDTDAIFRVLDFYRPDFVHFCETLVDSHGRAIALDGYIELQEKIKRKFPGTGIIRSIPIPMEGINAIIPVQQIAEKLEQVTDFFLTDTWFGNDQIGNFIGITGKRCHADPAKELVIRSGIPVILAGGLSPDNVYDAVMDIRPSGADSCTLTNSLDNDGKPVRFKKDFSKVEKFVSEARRAEKEMSKQMQC